MVNFCDFFHLFTQELLCFVLNIMQDWGVVDFWICLVPRYHGCSISTQLDNSVLQGGILGFNVMGCEGRKELDQFEARKKTRKLRQF